MNSIRRDEWELFLAQREGGTGWQWPLNLAVALHIAVFGSAAVLQNMTDNRPKFNLENIVTVDLINMTAPGPAPAAKEIEPEPAVGAPPEKPVTASESEAKPAAKKIEVIRPRQAVKKAIAPPPQPIAAKKSEPPAVQEKPVIQNTAEKFAVKAKVVEAPKPEKSVLQEAAAAKVKVIKPKQVVKKAVPAAKLEAAPKEAVSLNPVKEKTAPVKSAAEKAGEQREKEAKVAEVRKAEQARIAEAKKKDAQAKAAKLAEEEKARKVEQARIAEAKKKEAQAKAAKLAEEEKVRKAEQARIAEAKKKEEQAKAAKLAEEKRIAAEKARKAAEARKKLAEQNRREALAEAERIEREAAQARIAAEQAREQLAHALRKDAAVSAAVAAIHGNGPASATGAGGRGIGSGSSPAVLNQYAASLNGKISSCWKLPEVMAANKGLKTVVALTVSRKGAIENIKIEKKSGDALFDQSVLKALRSAEPLPDFPSLIREPKLEFALNFTPNGLTSL